MPAVPFKLNQDRRHHIPRQRHKVTNWPAYEASLRQRGSLTIWFTDEAVAAWQAEPRTTRGGQPWYSPLAILTALTFEYRHRNNLQQCVERRLQLEALAHDRHQHVDRNGDPDLRLHGVLRRAIELLDPQVLFDPLEKEFHLPAAFVQIADRQGRERHLIGKKDQRLGLFCVAETDAPQMHWIVLAGAGTVQCDGLVGDH